MSSQNANPNGPYPGRQIFVGTTPKGDPCFAYLVTGRNKESRERKAKKMGNIVRIMPSNKDTPFDPLRHYIAVKYDNAIGLATITNGIQTEAIYEAYRLSINLHGQQPIRVPELLHNLLEHAKAEPDSLHTPRIATVITQGNEVPQVVIGTIGLFHGVTDNFYIKPMLRGRLAMVSTYTGNMDCPEPNRHGPNLLSYKCLAENPNELAKHIFGISAAEYQGHDIRVCAVGGVFAKGKWSISIINA